MLTITIISIILLLLPSQSLSLNPSFALQELTAQFRTIQKEGYTADSTGYGEGKRKEIGEYLKCLIDEEEELGKKVRGQEQSE